MLLRPETLTLFAVSDYVYRVGNAHGLWSTLGWFAGLLVLTALVGFVIALAVFLFTFMRVRAGRSWGFSALYTVGGIALICVMAGLLNRDFPAGLLQSYVSLPWPLG